MAKFITIGYGNQEGYDRTNREVRDAAHVHDSKLIRMGAITGIAGRPIQVRNPDGRALETLEGPYMSTELPIAGFSVIEADSIEEAIALVSQTPCAVAHGVVEVWPLETIS
jgi:hypothetical protein